MPRPTLSTVRALRPHPRNRHLPHSHHARAFTSQPPLQRSYSDRQPLDSLVRISSERLTTLEIAQLKRRRNFAAGGVVAAMFATAVLVASYDLSPTPDKNDAGARTFPDSASNDGTYEEMKRSLRATGTSSVPFFPRTMTLPSSAPASTATRTLPAGTSLPGSSSTPAGDEFTLLGLGIRTVSFLRIQVYVVGLYVATSDVALLQAALVRSGAAEVEGASALVAGEKDRLKTMLLDQDRGVEVWDKILREKGIRSAVRVVPTRNTDHSHLRDGWVTGMMARSGNAGVGALGERFDDDEFGAALSQFKAMFGNRKLGKGKTLVLEREANGRLVGWEQPGKGGDGSGQGESNWVKMGAVDDERVGRLIWMGYLAGKHISSVGARDDIVAGVMDLVERPLGTVETQVV